MNLLLAFKTMYYQGIAFDSKILLIFILGFAILLPLGILQYIFRNKLLGFYQNLPASRKDSILALSLMFVKMAKIVLWMSPFVTVILSYTFSLYSQIDPKLTISLMVLLSVTIWLEFLFRKWVIEILGVSYGLH